MVGFGFGGGRRAVVEELAGLGVSVYTCARSQQSLQSSLDSWRQAGLQVDGSVCDLSLREARVELFRRVAAHFGGSLDILVSVDLLEFSPRLLPLSCRLRNSDDVNSCLITHMQAGII